MNYRRSHRIKRKKSKLKEILLSLFMFSSFCLFVYFLFFSGFFALKKIVVSGNIKISQENVLIEVQKETQIKKFQMIDNNLLLLDLGIIEKNILSSFPLISNVKIIRKFPNTINVLIDERVGVTIFCGLFDEENLEECFVLDDGGIIFEEFSEETPSLPIIKNISSKEDLFLGNKIIEEELLSTVLEFYLGMKNLDIQLREFLVISENRINAITKEGWEIYFNPKESTEWQLTKLAAVLSEGVSLEGREKLEYIELRFGNTAPFKEKD